MDDKTKYYVAGITIGGAWIFWLYLEKKIDAARERQIERAREETAYEKFVQIHTALLTARDVDDLKEVRLEAEYLAGRYPQFYDARYVAEKARIALEREASRGENKVHAVDPFFACFLMIVGPFWQFKFGRFLLILASFTLILYMFTR